MTHHLLSRQNGPHMIASYMTDMFARSSSPDWRNVRSHSAPDVVALAELAAAAPLSTAASSSSEASYDLPEGEAAGEGSQDGGGPRSGLQDLSKLAFIPGNDQFFDVVKMPLM